MPEEAVKTGYLSLFSNITMATIKWLAGIFGNSHALIADAIESTADIFSSAMVALGMKYSTKPADKNHPYGHGRAEPLITFSIAIFLLISAYIIAKMSIHNIQTPHKLPKPFTLVVLGLIILWKEASFRWVMKKGIQTASTSLQAEAWHHRADVITSLFAFVGISIALMMGPGYESADDWAALFASAVIVYNAYKIFRPAFSELMDEQNFDDLKLKIRSVAENSEGVKGTEKLFIRKVGMKYHVDLHLIVDGEFSVREGHEIAHILKDKILKKLPEIENVHIHVEPD